MKKFLNAFMFGKYDTFFVVACIFGVILCFVKILEYWVG